MIRAGVSLAATALLLAACAAPTATTSADGASQLCWVEFSRGEVPGALGAAGATRAVWPNTASGLLVRHPRGDVLIDAGWSANALAEMAELSPQKRPMAERVIGGLQWRLSAPEALRRAGHAPQSLAWILPTHAHYDHMGGAADLAPTPVLVAPAERAYLQAQLRTPDVVAASNIRAVSPRLHDIAFSARPYLGFDSSFDLHGDGSVVVVPLPGHTPGSVGVFVTVGTRRVFHIGDAAYVSEAVERGLPKSAPLRAFADHDGPATDAAVRRLAAFHREHPEIAIVPAHDREAWQALFGDAPRCIGPNTGG